MCFIFPLQSALRGYSGSPWGKLYSEWHLTPHRRGQCAVILLCFLLTDIFVRCRADLRNQSVPGAAHQAVFCFMLCCFLPPPNVIMPPTHPITRSHAAREAEKGDVDKDACAMAKDMSLWWRSLTHSHTQTHTVCFGELTARKEEAFKMDDQARESDCSGITTAMLDWKGFLQMLKSWAFTIILLWF